MDEDLSTSLHHIHISRIPLAVKVFLAILLPDVLYGLVLILSLTGTGLDVNTLITAFWVINAAKFVLVVFVVLYVVLEWTSTIYYLDEHHLIKYSGAMHTQQSIYELRSIRTVDRKQSWLGKLANYGDIELLFGASGYREELVMQSVIDPHKYERIFAGHLGAEARQYLTPPPKV